MERLLSVKPKSLSGIMYKLEKGDGKMDKAIDSDTVPVALDLESYIIGKTNSLNLSLGEKVQFMQNKMTKLKSIKWRISQENRVTILCGILLELAALQHPTSVEFHLVF